MIQKGYFIITDITGYTAYLSKSELDHANEILKSLFDAQVEIIKPPLIISNLQGDAILSYVPEGSFLQKQTLVELVEQIYFAFTQKRELMAFNTSCTCRACRNISGLDLKIFIHYGDYMLQQVAGRSELLGSDVILAHRMMKNKVTDQTGVKAYALFTKTAGDALEIHEYCPALKNYNDSYEHVGEVEMLVHCLQTEWEREKEKTRNIVTKEEAWVGSEVEIEVPLALVWDYVTKIDLKIEWMGFSDGGRMDDLGGRVGEESTFHCAHGELDFRFKVVDWYPFRYFTCDEVGMNGVQYDCSYHFIPTETGTRLANYVRKPDDDPGEEFRSMMQTIWDQAFMGLDPYIKQRASENEAAA